MTHSSVRRTGITAQWAVQLLEPLPQCQRPRFHPDLWPWMCGENQSARRKPTWSRAEHTKYMQTVPLVRFKPGFLALRQQLYRCATRWEDWTLESTRLWAVNSTDIPLTVGQNIYIEDEFHQLTLLYLEFRRWKVDLIELFKMIKWFSGIDLWGKSLDLGFDSPEQRV